MTRQAIAMAQMLMGALFIHLAGGRLETHFHVFCSLALLAFYRDARVLVIASIVVALDHWVRGLYWPRSVYGTSLPNSWRWVEHTCWVAVEDVFLIRAVSQNIAEMHDIADRESALGLANAGLASEVSERLWIEGELRHAHDELEARVAERTVDLRHANMVLSSEINKRTQAQEAQRRMGAILDATTDFVGIADADGRVVYVNAAAHRLIGLNLQDVPPLSISEYLPDWANAVIASEAIPMMKSGQAWSGELALRHRDGGEIPVSVVGLAHRDSHGDVEFFSTIMRNMTERKRTEQEILLLNSQLERRLNRLHALRQIDTAITTSFDLRVTLSTLLDQVQLQLGVDAADVLLLDSTSRLEVRERSRVPDAGDARVAPDLENSVPGRVALECRAVHLSDLTHATCSPRACRRCKTKGSPRIRRCR